MRNRQQVWASKFPFFYGWMAVGIGTFTMFFTTPGQSNTFSIFMNSFIDDLGWSRTVVSSLFSTATLLAGACMLFVGRFVDRFGAKPTALLAAALLGAACSITSIATSQIVLFSGFFLARFSGKGALGLAAETVAPQWFERRRAFAIMLVSLGGTAGGVVFPLINSYLIQTIGWRPAFRVLAAGMWIIYIPIALLFFIGRPEDAGLQVDGKTSPQGVDGRPDDGPAEEPADASFKQKEAVRTAAYWILAFGVFQAAMNGTGIIIHFVSIFEQAGLSMTFAAQILSMGPLIALVSSVAIGFVLDRIRQPKFVLAATCASQFVALLLLAFLQSVGMAIVYAVLAGSATRAIIFCNRIITARIFGRRYIGGILGFTAAINVVGAAIGPIIFGSAYDTIGGYREILLLCSAFPLIACVSSFFIRNPRRIPSEAKL